MTQRRLFILFIVLLTIFSQTATGEDSGASYNVYTINKCCGTYYTKATNAYRDNEFTFNNMIKKGILWKAQCNANESPTCREYK